MANSHHTDRRQPTATDTPLGFAGSVFYPSASVDAHFLVIPNLYDFVSSKGDVSKNVQAALFHIVTKNNNVKCEAIQIIYTVLLTSESPWFFID